MAEVQRVGRSLVRIHSVTDRAEQDDLPDETPSTSDSADLLREPPDDYSWIEIEQVRGGEWEDLFGNNTR
jgi:hypothetical protein